MMKAIGASVLFIVLAIGTPPAMSSAQQGREPHLVVSVGSHWWTYNHDQLKAMATKDRSNTRGDKKNPVIPLDVLLTKDTRLSLDRVIRVVIVGQQHVLLLEGDDLKHVNHLMVMLGTKYTTLVPETDETYQALRPILGKPRLEDIERIDVVERR